MLTAECAASLDRIVSILEGASDNMACLEASASDFRYEQRRSNDLLNAKCAHWHRQSADESDDGLHHAARGVEASGAVVDSAAAAAVETSGDDVVIAERPDVSTMMFPNGQLSSASSTSLLKST